MRLTRKRVPDKQQGVVTIEAAFVLPLLFMLLFFILDFGRIFHQMVAVTNAAHSGATYGAQSPAHAVDYHKIILVAKQDNDAFVVIPRHYCSCPKASDEESCTSTGCKMHIEVTVEVGFAMMTGLLPLPDILNLSQTTTFRVQ